MVASVRDLISAPLKALDEADGVEATSGGLSTVLNKLLELTSVPRDTRAGLKAAPAAHSEANTATVRLKRIFFDSFSVISSDTSYWI
jgi:hypothetical protein